MKRTTKWTEKFSGHETRIEGFLVSRSTLSSGKHLYWVHWIENPTWAASHSRMSVSPHRSMQSVRAMIRYLQSKPGRYYNPEQARRAKEQAS